MGPFLEAGKRMPEGSHKQQIAYSGCGRTPAGINAVRPNEVCKVDDLDMEEGLQSAGKRV